MLPLRETLSLYAAACTRLLLQEVEPTRPVQPHGTPMPSRMDLRSNQLWPHGTEMSLTLQIHRAKTREEQRPRSKQTQLPDVGCGAPRTG